jgi:ABC-type transport system involved in cytochrome bd biosynthesis fused ATPase/permease subunit
LRKQQFYIVMFLLKNGVSLENSRGGSSLKVAGFLLLLSGWALVAAAVALLGSAPARTGFVMAAIGVEIVGMTLVARSHLPVREDRG